MDAIIKGNNLGISRKASIEICSFIRNKTTENAKKILEKVIQKKEAVPFKRFTGNIAHKRGNIAAGRYPIKASQAILNLIKGVEANARHKGMSSNLVIDHIS